MFQERCVHRVFEARVRERPHATAVIDGERSFSYGELDRYANQLAHHLGRRGVRPNARVGVQLERSAELIVALLAVLKADSAYLPLELGQPLFRRRFMLEDTEAEAVIGVGDALGELAGDCLAVDLEAEAGAIAARPAIRPHSRRLGEDAAYVMYTSGSTGLPNGVEVPHRAVVGLIDDDYVPFATDYTFLLLSSPAFDASTFEIWGALLHGTRLLTCRFPVPTRSLLEGHNVSCLWLTAALFNSMIDRHADNLAGIRHLLVGGEALSVKHVQRALDQLPDTQLVNGYGPTECTTFSCTYAIPRELDPATASIPIGRPLRHTRLHLLDAERRPVPDGVSGELYIGGGGVSLGYVNRPDLTADRFISNRLAEGSGARLYKTGDLCRRRRDGQLEFLGRLDDQVKIRGYRIEPGEIEGVLFRHPQVRQCAVVVHSGGRDRHLVAYYTAATDAPGLRQWLAARLPAYMLPERLVRLDAIPLTANGKIDREALRAAVAPVAVERCSHAEDE